MNSTELNGPEYLGALAISSFFVLFPAAAVTYAVIMSTMELGWWLIATIVVSIVTFAVGIVLWLIAAGLLYKLLVGKR